MRAPELRSVARLPWTSSERPAADDSLSHRSCIRGEAAATRLLSPFQANGGQTASPDATVAVATSGLQETQRPNACYRAWHHPVTAGELRMGAVPVCGAPRDCSVGTHSCDASAPRTTSRSGARGVVQLGASSVRSLATPMAACPSRTNPARLDALLWGTPILSLRLRIRAPAGVMGGCAGARHRPRRGTSYR